MKTAAHKLLFFLLIFIIGSACLCGQNYVLDREASEITFSVSNLKWNTVRGTFSDIEWQGRIDIAQPEQSDFEVSVASASVRTGIGKRDRHLAEPEFFDAEKYPRITVRSSDLMHAAVEGVYLFTGTLEIKGIVRPLECRVRVNEAAPGFTAAANFTLLREDFDLGSNHSTFIIGEEVAVEAKIVMRPE